MVCLLCHNQKCLNTGLPVTVQLPVWLEFILTLYCINITFKLWVFPELHYLWCGNGFLGKRFWTAYFWNSCCWHVAHSIIHASLSHPLRDTLLPDTLLRALTDSHSNTSGKLRPWWQLSCVSAGWFGASPFDVTDGETVALIWGVMVVVKDRKQAKLHDLT